MRILMVSRCWRWLPGVRVRARLGALGMSRMVPSAGGQGTVGHSSPLRRPPGGPRCLDHLRGARVAFPRSQHPLPTMGRLEGKSAVITGSGRGIGRATAVRFAQEGAAVVINDVDAEPAEETAALVKETGSEALVSTDDTTSLDVARRLMDSAAERFGKIDILVNNAGVTRDKTFHNLDDELWDFVLDTNLKTAFHSTLAAMPYLREVAKRETSEQGQPAYHRKINLTTSVAALVGN